ncbi:hypothetical protein ACFOY2_48985 [Nonomuraea purpurea]|uniref:Uncharacterized protein n=1 Tax=Nonomuraea purpurea TaxID=1849276 RepID=A0ABV8GR19_9ACTN
MSISVARQAEHAVRAADVIVTTTGSRRPILHGDWLRPGQHVTATGADDRTKGRTRHGLLPPRRRARGRQSRTRAGLRR